MMIDIPMAVGPEGQTLVRAGFVPAHPSCQTLLSPLFRRLEGKACYMLFAG